jgi:hypothetical protein
MDRRGFVAGAVSVLAASFAAGAQQGGKIYRIGILSPVTEAGMKDWWGSSRRGSRNSVTSKVATLSSFGASAMGIAANEAAMANPPHLVAAFVMVARSSVYEQSSFIGGVFRKELNEDWLKRQKAESVLDEIFKRDRVGRAEKGCLCVAWHGSCGWFWRVPSSFPRQYRCLPQPPF